MEKQKIGLICDEGGDLPKDIVEKHQIGIVPFKVDLGEMKDIPGNIYQKIREAEKRGIKSFIKTSQPSPGDFLLAFKEKLKRPSTRAKLGAGPVPHRNEVSGAGFEELICITITSKHSGTYNSAIQAKNFLEENLKNKVEIIDSLNGSTGEGLLVLKAISLIKKGLKIKEISENLKKAISKTHLIFMLQDPKWLEASGRLSHILAS